MSDGTGLAEALLGLPGSWVSLLSAAGVPVEEIADVVGRKGRSPEIAEVYRHRVDPVIDSGVEAMESLFGDGSN